jgi:hypothetical protein
MLRSLVVVLGISTGFLLVAPSFAQMQQSQPEAAHLADLLDITGLIDVMRIEGRENAVGVDSDLLGGQGGAAWLVTVDKVYDPVKLRASFEAGLAHELAGAPEVQADMARFFGSDLGKRIVQLEVTARRTLLDDTAEAATKALWDKDFAQKSHRSQQIEAFAQINDLIESNVTGALNSNLAFFRGLSAGGAFEQPMPEDDMLAQVWSQEAAIRADTADWLYPFLMLAYKPLSNAELDQYIAFSKTKSGKKINAAIFAAFDSMFVQLSAELGASAARMMSGEDI